MVGTLSGVIAIGTSAPAPLSGNSLLTAQTLGKYARAANLTGAGALDVASALSRFGRSAALGGSGLYLPDTRQIYPSAPSLVGAGDLSGFATSAVAFDAVGAGRALGGTGVIAWQHNISANATALIVIATVFANATNNTVVSHTVVGGKETVEIPLLGVVQDYTVVGNLNPASHYVFGMMNPPTGLSKTVNVDSTQSAYVAANSMSYFNVSSLGSVVSRTGTGTNATQTVASAPGQMVAQSFASGYTGSGGAITGYNQTQRYNVTFVQFKNGSLVMGDAPGAASVGFAATMPNAPWAALAIPLLP